jgi:multiple sugar transport system substrate-binding protein
MGGQMPAQTKMMREASSDSAGLSRRAALGVLGAAAAGFVLFGPRGSGDAAAGRVIVDYWEKWTGHEGRAMQQVVDEFNASQQRIYVRYFVTSNIGQKALIAIAGGSPPDIIGLWNFNLPAYARSGAIVPLDELAKGAGLLMSDYRPGVQRVMLHHGVPDGSEASKAERWYGVVNTAGTLALYCNREMFRKAGLDADKLVTTIEELDEAQRAISKAGASGGLVAAGHLHLEPGWWSWLWGYHFGGSIYDAGGGKFTIDSAENLAAYAWMQQSTRTLGKIAGASGDEASQVAVERFRTGLGSYNTPQNGFLSGKVAMVLQGPWLANIISEFAPNLDYAVVPFPVISGARKGQDAVTQGVSLVDTDVLAIPRGAKNPEAAMEFIAFTQRPDITERLALAHGKICPLVKVSDGFIREHPNRGLAVHNALADSPRAFVVPKTRAWPEVKNDFDSMVQRLWRLEARSEEELPALQARAAGYLQRIQEQEARRVG